MKRFVALFLSMMFVASIAMGKDWRVVAISTPSCHERVEVLAKSGEKFVYVDNGKERVKLESEDGSAFSEESGRGVVFKNSQYIFTQPSMVDPNPPKLEMLSTRLKSSCKMRSK